MSENPIALSIIHHRQKPVESAWEMVSALAGAMERVYTALLKEFALKKVKHFISISIDSLLQTDTSKFIDGAEINSDFLKMKHILETAEEDAMENQAGPLRSQDKGE